jgi:hypothetical protein
MTSLDMKNAIADIQSKLNSIREQKIQLEQEKADLMAGLIKLEWGVYPGVRVSDGKNDFIITRTDEGFSRPYVYGNKIKKDGTPSKAEQWVSNWQIVEATQ